MWAGMRTPGETAAFARVVGAEPVVSRLKVYQASFGFRESVVAAPNQKAALEAWGARQNLFAEALARVSDDPRAIKAALDHPGVPLNRPVGSTGAFTLDTSELPEIPVASNRKAKATASGGHKTTPADRGALVAAEAALHEARARRRAADDDFHVRLRELEQKRAEAREEADAEVAAAVKAVEHARRDYLKAGGDD